MPLSRFNYQCLFNFYHKGKLLKIIMILFLNSGNHMLWLVCNFEKNGIIMKSPKLVI